MYTVRICKRARVTPDNLIIFRFLKSLYFAHDLCPRTQIFIAQMYLKKYTLPIYIHRETKLYSYITFITKKFNSQLNKFA